MNNPALRHVVKALERRFPNHNGPFEYGTRLAEEAGELIEVLHEARQGIVDDRQKEHLVKEQQDVLRVALGIAGIYHLEEKLPGVLADFGNLEDPRDVGEYIARLGVACGELASAVNHAEGMGVKKEKHGEDASIRVFEKVQAVMQVVMWTVYYFDAATLLEAQIDNAYQDYKEKGFIF